MRIFCSRFVLPITSPSLEDGAVVVDGPVIRDIGPSGDIVRKYPGAECLQLGHAVILPGLVNVHTHLELSGLGPYKERKKLFGTQPGFVDWLVRLAVKKRLRGKRSFLKAMRNGLAMLAASGTTCCGDITDLTEAPRLVEESGLRAVLFFEALGFNPSDAKTKSEEMEMILDSAARDQTGMVTCGLSPHAPYTVSARHFILLGQLAQKRHVPIAIHVSESSEETKLTRESRGQFVDKLFPLIGWSKYVPEPTGKSPVGYLDALGVLRKGTLAIHAVHADDSDIAILKKAGAGIAHCPRSNFFLKVGRAPVRKFLESGIPVGLGTDSLASNTTLSLWDEMRFARDIHPIEPSQVLRMATLDGAQALGLDGRIGSLEPGKEADIIAVLVDGFMPGQDLAGFLVATGREERIKMVMVAGKEVPLFPRAGRRKE